MSDDYRTEVVRLRNLATSVLITKESGRKILEIARVYETLARADETLSRSKAMYKPSIV